MNKISGGICTPRGFYATGAHIGIKRKSKDLSLLYTEAPAKVAATFTKNKVKAAPVIWNQKIIKNKKEVKAIIINSGIANACTGLEGEKNNQRMAVKTANCLELNPEEVLVASTGVIGVQLPINVIEKGIENLVPQLGSSKKDGLKAAEAILTTDTFVKEIAVTIEIAGKDVSIGGMAKGSGMIHPNMATMLAFLTTDLNISKKLLAKAMKESVEDSYNMISVDGDTSTNDMSIIMANGEVGNICIEEENEAYFKFKEALHYVNKYLAREIVKDGEGASKFLEVKVEKAKTIQDAKKIIKSVISSNLVKTAFFGEDANWGRIIAAMGYSGAEFNPETVSISFSSKEGELTLVKKGKPMPFAEKLAAQVLSAKSIIILIQLDDGDEGAVGWGCDLSYEYVKINGEYRT